MSNEFSIAFERTSEHSKQDVEELRRYPDQDYLYAYYSTVTIRQGDRWSRLENCPVLWFVRELFKTYERAEHDGASYGHFWDTGGYPFDLSISPDETVLLSFRRGEGEPYKVPKGDFEAALEDFARRAILHACHDPAGVFPESFDEWPKLRSIVDAAAAEVKMQATRST